MFLGIYLSGHRRGSQVTRYLGLLWYVGDGSVQGICKASNFQRVGFFFHRGLPGRYGLLKVALGMGKT